jgi:hypothetical protein
MKYSKTFLLDALKHEFHLINVYKLTFSHPVNRFSIKRPVGKFYSWK